VALPDGERKFRIVAIGYAAQPLLTTKLMLEDAGYVVITAVGIRKGLQAIGSAPADLVLLNGSIPEFSKLLLSQRIRKLAPEISVVVVSEGDPVREHFSPDCVLTHGNKTDLLKCIDLVLAGLMPLQHSSQGKVDPVIPSV
jgi:CheY-like chemotaxis protein